VTYRVLIAKDRTRICIINRDQFVPQLLSLSYGCVSVYRTILRFARSRQDPKKRVRTCTIGAVRKGHIGKRWTRGLTATSSQSDAA